MEDFQHHQSEWDLIKEYVPDSELSEIRTVLGEGLIDMYTETYSEVQMWKQIWHEVQSKMSRPQSPCMPLADPPAVKDLIRAELQLLLLTLLEKTARLGRDGDEVVSRYSPRVVSYALGDSGRKGSPCSQHETPMPLSRPPSSSSHRGSRSSSRLSSCSNSEDKIEDLRHKLNVTHIDEVVSCIKSFLTEKCEAFKKDIQFLQDSVELEYQKGRELELMEPSLTELKEERRIIQRDLHIHGLMSETSDKLKTSSLSVSSRDIRLTGLPASDSEMDNPSTRINCLSPNPSPPHFSRPVHSGKVRHRLFLNATQPLPSSSPSCQPQQLDQDHFHTSLSCLSSTTFTTEGHPLLHSSSASSATVLRPSSCLRKPRQEAHAGHPMRAAASSLSAAAGLVHRQQCGTSAVEPSVRSKQLGLRTEAAGARVLLPTPPAVQKVANRSNLAKEFRCVK